MWLINKQLPNRALASLKSIQMEPKYEMSFLHKL